ncbi:hypothetical protein [Streptomyces acidiscabies]|uniref:hypothetical protein n=1 Tax=Streptomyces acidiscabies TaxID=42234 RepID=UPI00067B6C55|nr:hypothetical protein [Streptomyces acidiscabies]
MNTRRRLRLVLLGIVGCAVAGADAVGWRNWMWFPLVAVVAGAFLVDLLVPNTGGRHARGEDEPLQDTPEPPTELPYQETFVSDIPVRSAVEDCPFLFSATIRWHALPDSLGAVLGSVSGQAVSAVLRRVENCTAGEHPNRAEFLRHWVEGTVGMPFRAESGTLMVHAVDVQFTLRHADRRHLEELDDLRRTVSSWERHRDHERNRRAYLKDDVLSSPGSAAVWWLLRHEEEIERAVEMVGPLSCLSAVANEREIPEPLRHLSEPRTSPSWAREREGRDHPGPIDETAFQDDAVRRREVGEWVSALLDDLGCARGTDERRAFVHRLVRMVETSGRAGAAEALRQDLFPEREEFPDGGSQSTPTEEGQDQNRGHHADHVNAGQPGDMPEAATDWWHALSRGPMPTEDGTTPPQNGVLLREDRDGDFGEGESR